LIGLLPHGRLGCKAAHLSEKRGLESPAPPAKHKQRAPHRLLVRRRRPADRSSTRQAAGQPPSRRTRGEARGEAMLCTVDAYAPPKNPKNSDKSQISTIYASPKFCSYAPTRDVHPLIFCSSFATAADHQTRRPPPQMRASRRP
jgi:hypothetical protein